MHLYENNTRNKANPFLTLDGYIDQVYVATINLYGNYVRCETIKESLISFYLIYSLQNRSNTQQSCQTA